jgi:hypothetical protein
MLEFPQEASFRNMAFPAVPAPLVLDLAGRLFEKPKPLGHRSDR